MVLLQEESIAMVMSPEEFLRGVNTFQAEIDSLTKRVEDALKRAQNKGERSFSVYLGSTPEVAWKAVQSEWRAGRWEVTHDFSGNESRLDFKPLIQQ